MSGKTVKPEEFAAALERELTIYGEDVEKAVHDLTKASAEELRDRTRATAPVGYRGKFKSQIAIKEVPSRRGTKFVWYVKKPDYRLTHLLVHGHAKRNGGRTRANPFLHNALAVVLPSYEKRLEEAVKRAGKQ